MTGPRVEPPHVLSLEEFDKAQPSGMTRVLSLDEFDQAQGMTATGLKSWKLPSTPMSFAPRDATATKADNRTKGKPLAEFNIADPTTYANPVLRQIVNPAMDNPLTTIATTMALPVPGLGHVMGGTMALEIARYGYQKYRELTAPPEHRAIMEADPDRMSGEAAAVQGAMLGLGSLIHVGVKAYKNLDVSPGMMDATGLHADAGQMGMNVRPALEGYANSDFAARIEHGAEDAAFAHTGNPPPRPPGFTANATPSRAGAGAKPVEGMIVPETVTPGRVKPIETLPANASLEERAAYDAAVRDYHAKRLAEDAADLSASRTEAAAKIAKADAMRPRRRAAKENYFETEQGAQTLGAVAARHGLPEDANPYHPESPFAEPWSEGHAAGMGGVPDGAVRVHHGTSAPEFNEFSTEHLGRNDPSFDEASGAGVFFTSDRADAEFFAQRAAERHGGNARVVTADVGLKNPAIVSESDVGHAYESLRREIEDLDPTDDRFYEKDTLLQDLENSSGRTSPAIARAIIDKMASGNHDGVIVRSEGDPDWYVVKNPKAASIVRPDRITPLAYPEGFSMGGGLTDNRIPGAGEIPATAKGIDGLQQSHALDVPEGATPETIALANALKPSRFRGHTQEALANEALDAQTAIEQAQAAVEHSRQRGLVGEAAQADLENRGVSYSDESEATSKAAEKALTAAKTRMAQIEREFAMRGVRGDELADVMQGAKELRAEREGMRQDETLAGVTGDPFTEAPSPSTGLTPIKGTGETRTRGLSAGVEQKAIANKVASTLGDLPEYATMNVAEQGNRASALLASDPALARRIALGEAPAPDNILPESVFVAVENKAIAEGDVGTLRDLAIGKLSTDATTMGQRIRMLGERDPESAVGAMQTVERARSGGKNVPRATLETVAEIRKALKGVDVKSDAWTEFVNSLRC